MKTFIPKVDPNNRKWWVVDVEGHILGRAAVQVANILRGKNKPIFTPHLDAGDHVVVVNARSIRVTGKNKPRQKTYYRFSGYPGGLRSTSLSTMLRQKPEETFRLAVRRMLPKNRLGRKMIKKLHVYADGEHRHQAQKPEPYKL
ncbi:MAG TPA: 50S ribosomal protein L13 [candidate division Zixibacteria bacterium]|nr:50S ribosomal protein L13 [candidate division Zixibacteria bacterium]MDD4916898.1 50S ribosomal protein L13 [candidate division Zixibacteria bacterium]MDM7972160.1 50S ribosomal protein L13 [candidate division Zixibacteria bacterium]HOD67336.1 50S ribosomal protein L13 [candidate division Zixibacteria bacterium]HPC11306.1 50S ribosomal protein L13 [candidate division Zixibacteria bacterium]